MDKKQEDGIFTNLKKINLFGGILNKLILFSGS